MMLFDKSKDSAKSHFQQYALPRIVRDEVAERAYHGKTEIPKALFRRVSPSEYDRGMLYPLFNFRKHMLAHFGLGISSYFMQIIVLIVCGAISSFVMISSMGAYKNRRLKFPKIRYDDRDAMSVILQYSGACQDPINVSVAMIYDSQHPVTGPLYPMSQNVSVAFSPSGLYRHDCDLPSAVIATDIALSFFLLMMVLAAKILEFRMQVKIDESIQTSSDYTVEVLNPDPKSTDVEEWFNFFSRYGNVQIITIARSNTVLLQKIVEWNRQARMIETLKGSKFSSEETTLIQMKKMVDRLEKVEDTLKAMYLGHYPVSRVFATFEFEQNQRLCLSDLEVPDLQANLDIATSDHRFRSLFRGKYVLNVQEPVEPDNIIWAHVEKSNLERFLRKFLIYLITAAMLYASFVLLSYSQKWTPIANSLLIAFLEISLSEILRVLSIWEAPLQHGELQSSLQIKLFSMKLLVTTIFPFVAIPWNQVLNPKEIFNVICIQISTCLLDPIFKSFDFAGFFSRHIIAPLVAFTQEEFNSYWTGTGWDLADRYCHLGNVIFVCLFFSLITPAAFIIATISLSLLYIVDKYNLLRRWHQVAMMDNLISARLRQQAVFAVAVHLYISLRIIYSWPMDDVNFNQSTRSFEVVDKFPPINIFDITVQPWHSKSQRDFLVAYKSLTFVAASFVIYLWIILPVYEVLQEQFCQHLIFVGKASTIPFSSLANIKGYVPVLSVRGESFIAADTQTLPSRHKPDLLASKVPLHLLPFSKLAAMSTASNSTGLALSDISLIVPEVHRKHVLGEVKYFGDNFQSDPNNLLSIINNSVDPNTSTRTSSTGTTSHSQRRHGRGHERHRFERLDELLSRWTMKKSKIHISDRQNQSRDIIYIENGETDDDQFLEPRNKTVLDNVALEKAFATSTISISLEERNFLRNLTKELKSKSYQRRILTSEIKSVLVRSDVDLMTFSQFYEMIVKLAAVATGAGSPIEREIRVVMKRLFLKFSVDASSHRITSSQPMNIGSNGIVKSKDAEGQIAYNKIPRGFNSSLFNVTSFFQDGKKNDSADRIGGDNGGAAQAQSLVQTSTATSDLDAAILIGGEGEGERSDKAAISVTKRKIDIVGFIQFVFYERFMKLEIKECDEELYFML